MIDTTNGSHAAPPRTFIQAIKVCFTKYATFRIGRASRSEFWWFQLFFILVGPLLGTIGVIYLVTFALPFVIEYLAVVSLIVMLLMTIPSLAVGARRLHDIGRSGWWQLICFTGIGILVLWYWWIKAGDAKPNKYNINA